MNVVPTFVALLRGVNVGGASKVPMAALRSSLAATGFEDVVTYIQSGNVVLRSPLADASEVAARIEQLLAGDFGVPARVVIRTPAELVAVEAANPFSHAERSKVHVVFLGGAPAPAAVAELDPNRSPPDELAVRGREIYLHLPNGAGRTKLTIDYFERRLGVAATHRNWNTLLKLIQLAAAVR
jgi:uncharacterized protein (DUF1697 family)